MKIKPISLGAALFATALIVLTHFPFEGYVTQTISGGRVPGGIDIPYAMVDYPFLYWVSRGSLVDAMSTVKAALIGLFAIWIAFGIWTWAQNKNEKL